MRKILIAAGIATATATTAFITLPVIAQAPAIPGTKDASRVTAGNYVVDGNHTQVVWKVDHLGFTPLYGTFGAPTGTLSLDPAKPEAAKVSVTFPMSGMAIAPASFLKHLSSADFFETEKFDSAKFESTSVAVTGETAKISGNLTIKGITKPVVLDAKFYGAGNNPRGGKLNIGFTATAKIKRSDFGLGMAVPIVSDETDLKIVAAFEKAA